MAVSIPFFGVSSWAAGQATTYLPAEFYHLRRREDGNTEKPEKPILFSKKPVPAHPSMWIPSSVTRRGILALGGYRPATRCVGKVPVQAVYVLTAMFP